MEAMVQSYFPSRPFNFYTVPCSEEWIKKYSPKPVYKEGPLWLRSAVCGDVPIYCTKGIPTFLEFQDGIKKVESRVFESLYPKISI